MNKWKAGAKGRGSRGPKKVCHVPCAVCGSFCVIGWLFFRLYQSQALLCGVRTTKLKVEMRVQPMEKKSVQQPILLQRFVSLPNWRRCFMWRGVTQSPMGGRQ